MSFKYTDAAQALVFDDEPLESLLYGRGEGPTRASVFTAAYPLIEDIRRSFDSDDLSGAIKTIERLFATEIALPIWACKYFISELGELVPNLPRPIVSQIASTAEPVLRRIFEYVRRFDAPGLVLSSGALLYRYYESLPDYAHARTILRVMIEAAKTKDDAYLEAQLINNHGYDYLLEEKFGKAESDFQHALNFFKLHGYRLDIDNTRANLLTCRFGNLPPDRWSELLTELKQVNRALCSSGDWRARKTFILLARHAEARGLLRAATGWVRRAVLAAGDQPSQHRLDDLAYLGALKSQRSRQNR